ncbi:MFS transporter [Xylogone sp. PMI_703]|nr:MFS transporter [Xylogone sp. PMI_703]
MSTSKLPATSAHRVVQDITENSTVQHLASLDTTPWYRKRNLFYLYLNLIPAVLGCNMTSGYDGSVINGLQAVTAWNTYFGKPHGAVLGVLSAMFMFGEIASLPIVPWINDRFGRKKSIVIGSLIILVGVILQSASVNIAMFLVARFIIGTGVPVSVTGAAELIAELTHPNHRSVLTGLFNNSWYAGSIVAAGVTLGTYHIPSQWSWRIPSLLQFSPSLLQLIFIWWIPESPRWLISKDRLDEAMDVLVKYHGEGDREAALPQAEFTEIQQTIHIEMESSKHRWIELLRTRGNRHRIFIAATVGLFHAWSGNGLISYYLPKVLANVGISSSRKQNQINLSISCMALVTSSVAAFATKLFSRRAMWLTSFGLMAAAYWALTASSATFAKTGGNGAAQGTVAMIFIYQAVYSLMQPLQMIYTTEIFPFVYRAKGIALEELFNQAGSAFNQFVNPIGLAALAWKYYLVYCVWVPIEWLVMFFFYPETKGPTLEELAIGKTLILILEHEFNAKIH